MPAHRKRPDLRQRNTADRKTLEVIVGDRQEMPPFKRGWLKETKAEWAELWSSSIASAIEQADMAAVHRLFDMRDLQKRAWSRYRKQPYVDGSQGQPRPNPAFAEAMALERAIKALEDQLGLSPKARAQIGVSFASAQLSAAELNRMALESGETDGDGDEVVDAELLDEWGEA